MTNSKLIAIALAALLVVAGSVAAAPGQSPDDAGANTTAATDVHQSDDGANETASAGDATHDGHAADAPPTEMPENASDQVGPLHELIHEKRCGCYDGRELSARISALVGNDDASAAGEARGNATDDATAEIDVDADASADAGDDHASAHANASAEADADAHARQDGDAAGPTGDVPEQAADHVSAIHDAISSFLSGDGDGDLGATVSGIVSSGGQG